MSCTATWLCRHSAKTLRQNSTLSRKASGIGKASAAASSSAAAVWEAGAGSTDARTGVAARPASNNHAPADTTCIPRLFITILLSELAPLFAPSHVRSRPRPSTAMSLPSSRHSHEMPPGRGSLGFRSLARAVHQTRRVAENRPLRRHLSGFYALFCALFKPLPTAKTPRSPTQDIGRDLSNLNDQPPRIHPFCPRRTHLSAPSARARRRLSSAATACRDAFQAAEVSGQPCAWLSTRSASIAM